MTSQLDYLDSVAEIVARRGDVDDQDHYGPLSTGERVYVALAANRADLLEADGYTLAQAVARLDDGWRGELIRRWQYRGDPRKTQG